MKRRIKTASSIALPGRSEHNAGLAADLKGDDWDCDNWYNFEKLQPLNGLKTPHALVYNSLSQRQNSNY